MYSKTFSASSLSTYLSCPLKYYFTYDMKIRKPSNKYGDYGSAIHKVLEIFHKDKKIDPLILRSIRSEVDITMIPEFDADVAKFFKTLYYIDRVKDFKYAEFSLNVPLMLNASTETKLKGRIDRLDIYDSKATIIDYKTSREVVSKHLVEGMYVKTSNSGVDIIEINSINDLSFAIQIKMYITMFLQTFKNINRVVFELWYVKNSEILRFESCRDDSDKFLSEIQNLTKKIHEETTPKKCSPHQCKYCDYKQECDIKEFSDVFPSTFQQA